MPQVLVKANIRPSVVPGLDSLLLLQEVLLRECWRNASGVVPESLVVPGLSGREIALSLPGPKRGRDSIQLLGLVAGWCWRAWEGGKFHTRSQSYMAHTCTLGKQATH